MDTAVVASITEELHAHLCNVLTYAPPDPDTDLIDSGALDSMAVVELVFHVEQTYGVALPIEDLDLDDLRTARRIAQSVVEYRAKAA